MSVITLSDVSKIYPPRSRGAAATPAVDHVDLEVRDGEIHGIIGFSGAGKSTLVRLINALERPTSGRVVVHGRDLTALAERALRAERQRIGMIFQQFNLFESKTVWGNIEFPLRAAGVPAAEHRRRISDLLHFVGLVEQAHAYPEQLSGGQKQRVGIARALATNPSILLADEATSALDPETTRDVLRLLRKVNEELGVTIVVITHEMEVVRQIAHRVSVMEKGRIVEQGDVFDVFAASRSEATRRLVAGVVSGPPQADEVAALRARHDGRILTVTFGEGSTSQADVFAALGSAGLRFEVVHGGIENIRGRTFGALTLAVTGDDSTVDRVLGELRTITTIIEED